MKNDLIRFAIKVLIAALIIGGTIAVVANTVRFKAEREFYVPPRSSR